MKQLVFISLLIGSFFVSKSQPIVNRAGQANTTQDARLMAKYNLFTPRYADTTTANLPTNIGIDSCGAVIFTYDENALWYRQCSPKMWVLLSNGNAPQYTADRGVQIITGDIIRLADTVEGAGTKLQWLYSKSAFRAGAVSGTQWNVANIGQYSFATGLSTTASGLYSVAAGNASSATGATSLAIGIGNTASGSGSIALGNQTTASGSGGAMSIGSSTTASGSATFASGQSTLASASSSAAFGNQSKAVGNSSISSGVGTYMNTLNGVVFGAYNDTSGYSSNNTTTQIATNPIFVIGNGSGIGSRSNAFSMLRNGATKFSAGITSTTDTTTFKPTAMDGDGNFRKLDYWATGGTNIYNSDGTLTSNRTLNASRKTLTLDSISIFTINTSASGYTSKSWYTAVPDWDDVDAGHKLYHSNQDASDTSIYQFSGAVYLKPYDSIYTFENVPVTTTPNTDSILVINTSNNSVGYISPSRLTGLGWSLTGNSGTVDGTSFLGTTDNVALNFRVNNQKAGRIDPSSFNTLYGISAGNSITSGTLNVAAGYESLRDNTTGASNAAFGYRAMDANTTGGGNTGIGRGALNANTTGGSNTALGFNADVSASNLDNATAIGANAIVDASNKIRLGDANVTVIEGQVAYTFPSDGRFKYEVKSDVPGIDFIKKLHPVTYFMDEKKLGHFSKTGEIIETKHDNTRLLHTGFIAQEVESAAKELGYYFDGVNAPKDSKGYYSLAYSQFVVPLVKAMQEQQYMIEKLQNEIEILKKKIK